MYEENNVRSGATFGFSLPTIGFITWLVFLILKVTGTWAISWFWVWFPFWIPWAIILGLLIIIIPIAVIIALKE